MARDMILQNMERLSQGLILRSAACEEDIARFAAFNAECNNEDEGRTWASSCAIIPKSSWNRR